jgi:hypothetical protein
MSEQNSNMNNPRTPGADANRDPITGTPGAHPIGAGLGAIGAGAAAGAAGGLVAGPVGAMAGAVVGAVAGAVVGKSAAEAVNPTIETKFWRETHATRPYANTGFTYDEYAPAYRYGWESFASRGSQGGTFESVEADLNRGWNQAKGTSRLSWEKAKEATRDAWNRVQLAAHRPE